MIWCCDWCGRELNGTGIDTSHGHFCCQHCADAAEKKMKIDRHSSKHRDPLDNGEEPWFWDPEYDEYMNDAGWWDNGAGDEY